MAYIIGTRICRRPPQSVPIQLKIFTPVGTAIVIVASEKAAVAILPEPGGEHVMTPDHEAEEADDRAREDDDRVAEQRLARERRQDLGDDAHRGQDQDVDLRMAEDPEKVLPEDRLPPFATSKKLVPKRAVEHQLDQRDGDRGKGENEQERGDQRHPHEHRQPHHRHARARAG